MTHPFVIECSHSSCRTKLNVLALTQQQKINAARKEGWAFDQTNDSFRCQEHRRGRSTLQQESAKAATR